jgi:hypothetical protein
VRVYSGPENTGIYKFCGCRWDHHRVTLDGVGEQEAFTPRECLLTKEHPAHGCPGYEDRSREENGGSTN